MDYYVDIKILPDPEFQESMLMGALFNKLHKALVELKNSGIAVSFPKYFLDKKNKGLGDFLRLHGKQESLIGLMKKDWLKGMHDHLVKSEVTVIPNTIGFISVRRKQYKYSNIAKLRRRYIKRHGVSEKEAVKALPESLTKPFKFPFVNVKSSSTNEYFPLYIEQKQVDKQVIQTDFNCYGLSKESTVPLF